MSDNYVRTYAVRQCDNCDRKSCCVISYEASGYPYAGDTEQCCRCTGRADADTFCEDCRPDVAEIGIGACGSERKALVGMFIADAYFVRPGEAEIGLGQPGAEAVWSSFLTNAPAAPGSQMTFPMHIPIQLPEPDTHVAIRFNGGVWYAVTPIVMDGQPLPNLCPCCNQATFEPLSDEMEHGIFFTAPLCEDCRQKAFDAARGPQSAAEARGDA